MTDVVWWVPGLDKRKRACEIEASCGLEVQHGHWRDQIFYDSAEVAEAFPDGLPADEPGWDEIGSTPAEDVKRWISQTFQTGRQFGKNQHRNHVHVAVFNGPPDAGLKIGDLVTKDGKKFEPGGVEPPAGVLTRITHKVSGETTVEITDQSQFIQANRVNSNHSAGQAMDLNLPQFKPSEGGILTGLPQNFKPQIEYRTPPMAGLNISGGIVDETTAFEYARHMLGERLALQVQLPQDVRMLGNI